MKAGASPVVLRSGLRAGGRGRCLWVVVHHWSSDGAEGGDVVTHGLGVPAVWFVAGAVLLLCAANVADAPRSIGRLSIAVACVGYLLVLAFGPLRVRVDMSQAFCRGLRSASSRLRSRPCCGRCSLRSPSAAASSP